MPPAGIKVLAQINDVSPAFCEHVAKVLLDECGKDDATGLQYLAESPGLTLVNILSVDGPT